MVIVMLSLVVLMLGGTVAAFATGTLKLPNQQPTVDQGLRPSPNAPANVEPTSTQPEATIVPGSVVTPSVSPSQDDPTVRAGWKLGMDEAFPADGTHFPPSSYPEGGAECTADGTLVATLTKTSTGSYRCPGIANPFTDLTVKVDVAINGPDSCGGIWYRYSNADGGHGYAARVCQDRVQIVSHVATGIKVLGQFFYPGITRLEDGQVAAIALRIEGDKVTVFHAGTQLGVVTDSSFHDGRVVLGVFAKDANTTGPYEATFHRIQLYQPL